MKAMITLPAEILYVRFASITAWMLAEIFAESLNAKESAAEFCHAFELSVSEAFTNAVRYAEPPEAEKKNHDHLQLPEQPAYRQRQRYQCSLQA